MKSDAEGASDARASGGGPPPRQQVGPATAAPPARTPSRRLGSVGTFASLRHRDYLLLWLSIMLMIGGSEMEIIARGWLVYKLTGSATILGIVAAGISMPLLATALFGGVVADRFNRKRLIVLYPIISTTVSLLIAVSITTEVVTWQILLVTSMMQGISWSFAWPARQALLPELVGKEKLSNALALNSAGMSATSLAAPAVAGFMYAFIGPDGVFYITSAMGALAICLTYFIGDRPNPRRHLGEKVFSEIRAGMTYVLGRRLLLALLAIGIVTSMLTSPFSYLLPVMVVDVYKLESGSYGLLVSAMGLGAVISGLVVASLGQWRRGLLLALGILAAGVCMMLVSLIPIYAAAIVILGFKGLGSTGPMALKQALVIEHVDDRFRGRVISFMSLNMGLTPLALIPAGFMIDLLSVRIVIAMIAALTLVVFLVLVTTQRKVVTLQ